MDQYDSTCGKEKILQMIEVLNKIMDTTEWSRGFYEKSPPLAPKTKNKEPDYFMMLVKEMDNLNDQLEDLKHTFDCLRCLLARVEDPEADEDFWFNYPLLSKEYLQK